MTNACHEIPNQYIIEGIPKNNMNSLDDRSTGNFKKSLFEKPNIIFIHDLKKNVGPIKYKNNKRNIVASGNKSKKKEKKRISEIKNIEPGNPKKTSIFKSVTKNSLGHM